MALNRRSGALAPATTLAIIALSLVGCGSGSGSSATTAATANSNSSGSSVTTAVSSGTGVSSNTGSVTGPITRSGTTSASTSGASAETTPVASTTSSTSTTASTTSHPAVAAQRVGNASLSWQAPATNTDGSALTNLAGFYIRYGTLRTNLSRVITIPTVGISRYVVDNLTNGTWYFIVSSYTTGGVESAQSAVVSKTI